LHEHRESSNFGWKTAASYPFTFLCFPTDAVPRW
jgi:hypothetical protein